MKKAVIKQAVLGMVATNCYICMNKETKELFIVDPADSADRISRMVSQMEGTPCAVLLTHGHFDHIGAADELRSRYEIPVYVQEEDEAMLENPALNLSGSWAKAISMKADQLLKDNDRLQIAGFDIKVLHTPGHTPGGCCYELDDEGILFSGDTLFCQSIGRTDFPGSSGRDMKQSLDRLLTTLPEEMHVLSGHGETTTIGFEKRNNPYA